EARVPMKAGPQIVTVAFVKKSYALAEDLMQPFERSTFDPSDPKGLPHVLSVGIAGPFNAAGSGDTPSRQRIFVCHPAAASEELPPRRPTPHPRLPRQAEGSGGLRATGEAYACRPALCIASE